MKDLKIISISNCIGELRRKFNTANFSMDQIREYCKSKNYMSVTSSEYSFDTIQNAVEIAAQSGFIAVVIL